MAELILTPDEKAAALWSDLDDAALGKLVKAKMAMLESCADQLDRTIVFASALHLCCCAAEMNAGELREEIYGVTQGGRELGDWIVTVKYVREGG